MQIHLYVASALQTDRFGPAKSHDSTYDARLL